MEPDGEVAKSDFAVDNGPVVEAVKLAGREPEDVHEIVVAGFDVPGTQVPG